MARSLPIRAADLRGAARLATDATIGLTGLVEAMHERIARLPGWPAPQPTGRTTGITGLVYRTIRGVTHVVGGSLDALLGLLTPALAGEDTWPERDTLVAALNGVLGDHLAASANPLATPMTLRHGGQVLPPTREQLAAALPEARASLLVLIHGLCMNEAAWSRGGADLGVALAQALGFTPIHVRYNSGLPVARNGRELAQQLDALCERWPRPVQRIVLLGHSMGGLVARSALHCGEQARQPWRGLVSDAVFLGTPHHGAPLERAGHWVDTVLGATPYAAPMARLGRLRSAGITDLRHGRVLDEPAPADSASAHLPLPGDVRCFAAAASLGERSDGLKTRLLGDGLVPPASALGRHRLKSRTLQFPPERQWVGQGLGHLDLLSAPAVQALLLRWLGPGAEASG